MNRFFLFLLSFLVISMDLYSSSYDTIPKLKINDYRLLIEKMIKENNIEGVSIALFNNDNILWAESFGFLNSKRKELVDEKTIFSIQSISKTLTATGVLIAVQEGLVDLDKPIVEYLPDFKINSCFEENPEKRITLRLLLSHTAGFTHEAPIGNNYNASFESYEKHFQSIGDTWLKFPVGSNYSYSNIGYDLAARIIEQVSGMSFSSYLQKMLFEPLSMNSATIDADENTNNKNKANGNDVNFKRIPIVSPLIGSGGVYINAIDLAKFVQFHLNGGKFQGKSVLDRNLLTEMYKPVINNYHSYALGVSIFESNGTFCVNHNGGGFGFGASMIWYPEYNFGCIILTNLGFSGVYEVNSKICSDLINTHLVRKDADLEVFNPLPYFSNLKQNSKKNSYCVGDSIYKNEWKKYLGTYKVKVGGGWKYKNVKSRICFVVYKKDNGLFLVNSRLFEYKPGLFFTEEGEVLDLRTKVKSFRNIELK